MDPSTIGFIGGTGEHGTGLALRFARAGHPIVIGSRDPARAATTVEALQRWGDLDVRPGSNEDAAATGDVVFLTVPWAGHRASLKAVARFLAGKVVVDVVNPLEFDPTGARSIDVPEGSAAEQAQGLVPGARIVSAFHDVSARRLLSDAPVDTDVLVCGEDQEAKDVVIALAGEIPGVRGVDAGPLRLSRHLEGMTAVLLGINRRYKVRSGLRITGMAAEHGLRSPGR